MATSLSTIQETYFYKEVRKTPIGVGVIYPGYPIYHLYKNVPDGTPYRLNEIEYWAPLAGLQEYKQYSVGDENVVAERTKYEPRVETVSYTHLTLPSKTNKALLFRQVPHVYP